MNVFAKAQGPRSVEQQTAGTGVRLRLSDGSLEVQLENPDTSNGRFRSAVIWYRRFSIGFGVAPIA